MQVNIFTYKLLLIPIHLMAHWAAIVVDMSEREIIYYDSMSMNGTTCLTKIR